MESKRKAVAEKEAAARRALDPQIVEDAERLVAAWNECQAKRMPLLFASTTDRQRGSTGERKVIG
jgi:hypothetical protein